jgi:hypothetical protein
VKNSFSEKLIFFENGSKGDCYKLWWPALICFALFVWNTIICEMIIGIILSVFSNTVMRDIYMKVKISQTTV